MGLTIPERGFLIVRDSAQSCSVPCLLGMNVIKKCQELVHGEFETTMKGNLDSNWRQRIQTVSVASRLSCARLAGKDAVHVPASSAAPHHGQRAQNCQ